MCASSSGGKVRCVCVGSSGGKSEICVSVGVVVK